MNSGPQQEIPNDGSQTRGSFMQYVGVWERELFLAAIIFIVFAAVVFADSTGPKCVDGTSINACSVSKPYLCEASHVRIDTLSTDEQTVLRNILKQGYPSEQYPFFERLYGLFHFTLNQTFTNLVQYTQATDIKLKDVRKANVSSTDYENVPKRVTLVFAGRTMTTPLDVIAKSVYNMDGSYVIRSLHGRLHELNIETGMVNMDLDIPPTDVRALSIAFYDVESAKDTLNGKGISQKPLLTEEDTGPQLRSACKECGCPSGTTCTADGSCMLFPLLVDMENEMQQLEKEINNDDA